MAQTVLCYRYKLIKIVYICKYIYTFSQNVLFQFIYYHVHYVKGFVAIYIHIYGP